MKGYELRPRIRRQQVVGCYYRRLSV